MVKLLDALVDAGAVTRSTSIDSTHVKAQRAALGGKKGLKRRLKDYHRVATRYDKLARNYLSGVTLAALTFWMRVRSSRPRAFGYGLAMPHLVPFAPEHFQILSSWFISQADVVQWGGSFLSFPLADEQLRLMTAEADIVPPSRLCWMAEHEGVLVGHAQLSFDWRNGNARLSRVAVAPRARGRGLAVPMLRPVLQKAFSRPEIERVELNVYTWNTLAISAYEKLGFKAEGVRRSSALVEGERWDTAIMGLLRHEWQFQAG